LSVSTTTVTVAPPARASLALALMHVAAGIAACSLPQASAMLVLAGVLASGVLVVRASGRIGSSPDLPSVLHLRPDGTLLVTDRAGTTAAGTLAAGRILGASLVALTVRLDAVDGGPGHAGRPARRIRLLLVAGDQSDHDLRSLRVWLRWQRPSRVDQQVDPSVADAGDSVLGSILKKCVAPLNSLRDSRSHRLDTAAGARSMPGRAVRLGRSGRRGGGS